MDESDANTPGVRTASNASLEEVVAPRCKGTRPGGAKLGSLETPLLLLVCCPDETEGGEQRPVRVGQLFALQAQAVNDGWKCWILVAW